MKFLLCALSVYLIACSGSKQISGIATDEFPSGKLWQAGLNAAVIAKMDSQILNQNYPNIHSVLIFRNNLLVFEKYYSGIDENWGQDLGTITHDRDSLHDLRSVTKSIVSALVGCAVAQKKIKSIDQKVIDFFPEYKHLDTGMKSQLTIKHLLTMSTGLVWNESVPYTDSNNSEVRMIHSGNPVLFVLSQPMNEAPGNSWKYNGGATQLLSSIVERVCGKKIDEFARENLFEPLGIRRYYWHRYPNTDIHAAASGLRLTSSSMLKFGLLYLNDGKYKGRQILPIKWVKESISEQISRRLPNNAQVKQTGYGFHFYIRSEIAGNKLTKTVIAIGNGNQRIYIDRENKLVVVITAGNYNKWDIKNNSDELVYDFIYPAF